MPRLEGKKAIVVGAGQTPGETIGNGRAMAILFAREGAEVLCVDRVLERAEETVAMIEADGGAASALRADVTSAADCEAIARIGRERLGRIDVLVNNVGIARGDAPPHAIDEQAWDLIFDVNLKGMALTTRHVLTVMREQRSGAILNISSLASIAGHHMVAYEVSKMGVNRLTTAVAAGNASYGIRCNAILPGLMDTPMAIVGISERRGISEEALRAERDARVPLGRMGTGWDTAFAALFLVSDEARFVTGVCLPVDGGMSTRIG
ncbi:MAG TPA: SDR family NAD(P)-dependent oxidoreductase [Thermoanaerobaculia bacterium]|nr:SDR family NAD(P)-dependent oxidoreductase [Thermoanaerobaculia bacterium]